MQAFSACYEILLVSEQLIQIEIAKDAGSNKVS